MYTLDRLGYRGQYDVYDHQGFGITNNHLGGRANVAQASGYALVIQDDGRSSLSPNMPDGSDFRSKKVNQTLWYRNYLAQGAGGLVGTASLWLIGENTAFETSTNPLITDLTADRRRDRPGARSESRHRRCCVGHVGERRQHGLHRSMK